jgi:hypothetical protein
VIKEESIIKAQVHLKDGEITQVKVAGGKSGVYRYVSEPDLVELVRTLASDFSDEQIARILRRKRIRTSKGLAFASYHVSNLRQHYGIAKGPRVPVRGEDIYTAQQAAELLHADRSTVIRWVEVGLLRGSQLTAGAPWRIQVRGEDLTKLIPTDESEDWLTLKAAAYAIGVSQQTVLQKLKSGELKGVRVRTGRRSAWRIRLSTDSYKKQTSLF